MKTSNATWRSVPNLFQFIRAREEDGYVRCNFLKTGNKNFIDDSRVERELAPPSKRVPRFDFDRAGNRIERDNSREEGGPPFDSRFSTRGIFDKAKKGRTRSSAILLNWIPFEAKIDERCLKRESG